MKTRAIVWERVQAALDARRDPFDDELVRRTLESDAELLEEVVQLRSTLELVARRPATTVRSRRGVAAAAAVLLLTAATIAALAKWPVRSTREAAPAVRPAARVVSLAVDVERITPELRSTRSMRAGRARQSVQQTVQSNSARNATQAVALNIETTVESPWKVSQ